MEDPCALEFVPHYCKPEEICDKAVEVGPFPLVCVPDWFVTQQEVRVLHDGNDFYDNDEIIEW